MFSSMFIFWIPESRAVLHYKLSQRWETRFCCPGKTLHCTLASSKTYTWSWQYSQTPPDDQHSPVAIPPFGADNTAKPHLMTSTVQWPSHHYIHPFCLCPEFSNPFNFIRIMDPCMCYFSRLEHIAHHKAKNKTVKTNLCEHAHTTRTQSIG